MKFLLLLLLIVPIFGQILRIPYFDMMGIMPTDIVVMLLCITFVFKSLQKKKMILTRSLGVPFLLFFAWALFSLFINTVDLALSISEFFQSFAYFLRYLAYIFVVFIGIQIIKEEPKYVEIIKNTIFISAFIIAVLGFLQLYFFPSFYDLGMHNIGWDPHIGRLLSTWFDPNFLGGYFVFVIFLIAGEVSAIVKNQGFSLKIFQNKKVLFLSVLMFILIFALVLTYSRSSYLAFIIAGIVFAFLFDKRLLLVGFISMSLLLSISPRMQERSINAVYSVQALFTETERTLDPTSRLRLQSWKVAGVLFEEKPFMGIGFNTLKTQQKKYWTFLTESHAASGIDASLLTVLATTGIIGLYGFLWFWGRIIFTALNQYLYNKDGFALGALSGFLGILVHSFFVNTLFFSLILPTLIISASLLMYKEK
jgi:O-antigen ligase